MLSNVPEIRRFGETNMCVCTWRNSIVGLKARIAPKMADHAIKELSRKESHADIEISPAIPLAMGFAISIFTSMGGVSGTFLLLPFQISVLGFHSRR
jgi:uncharacterized membrane protein YfcA